MNIEAPVLNEEQMHAIVALFKIECKTNTIKCDGPWCSARNNIKMAFGIDSE